MTTPYRADHVGSLLRPPELLEARAAYANGDVSLEQLRETEDARRTPRARNAARRRRRHPL